MHCSATSTPEWRTGPEGKGTLCNAYVPKPGSISRQVLTIVFAATAGAGSAGRKRDRDSFCVDMNFMNFSWNKK
jgi:hypothetical protein